MIPFLMKAKCLPSELQETSTTAPEMMYVKCCITHSQNKYIIPSTPPNWWTELNFSSQTWQDSAALTQRNTSDAMSKKNIIVELLNYTLSPRQKTFFFLTSSKLTTADKCEVGLMRNNTTAHCKVAVSMLSLIARSMHQWMHQPSEQVPRVD